MAVTMMISAEQYDANNPLHRRVDNYPGHEADRVCHHYDCPRQNTYTSSLEGCHARCRQYGPLYMETSFVGAVLTTGEMNGYDDSDFYAVVWDGKTVRRVEYATTRGWSYPNTASIDATEAVRQAAAEYLRQQALASWRKANEDQARTPAIGKQVRVTKGKHAGVEGTVFWAQEQRSRYGTWSRGMRLGIRFSDRKENGRWVDAIFCPEDYVVVLFPEQYMQSDEDLVLKAQELDPDPRAATRVAGFSFA